MTARLSAKEARRLGLSDDGATASKPRRERWPYASECWDCHERFTSEAAETRHLAATDHHRYQLLLVVER